MQKMNVTCPEGGRPGGQIPVQTPSGRLFQVDIPEGVAPGQQFTVNIPKGPAVTAVPTTAAAGPAVTAAPVTGTATSKKKKEVHVVHHHRYSYYPSYYYDDDPMACCGQGNACCLITFAIITMCMSLSLVQHVSWYYSGSDDECWYDYRCCNYYCTRWCYTYVCEGEWRSTQPISQDELPPPNLIGYEGNESLPVYEDDGGNGTPDYWSVIVIVCCGTIGSFFVIIGACFPVNRYGHAAPPKGMACTLITGAILFTTACICVGVQFFTVHEDEDVYNYFRVPQYQKLNDESLMSYLLNDKYYDTFANCVLITWILCCCLAIYTILYTICIFTIDERFTRPSRRDRTTASREDTVDYRL